MLGFLNNTVIASSYAGRDPQGGNTIEAFGILSKFIKAD